ncbi:MAG: hypothetical protein RQ757_13810 [Pseudomonadales bacterium]|nr:hypothetical protein [Pseudomonadales bacterium]
MKSILAVFVTACLLASNAMALDIAALERAMANPQRAAADKERDASRKAPQVLDFLGLEAGMSVLDINASTGWYTEVLSYAVGPNGKVYAQNTPGNPRGDASIAAIAEKTQRLSNIESWESPISELPANSIDFAITALNYHDFYNNDPAVASRIMAQVMHALKPGGILGIIDHQGNPGADNRTLHRIAVSDVVKSITADGFVVVGLSDVLDNPADDHTLHQGDDSLQRNTDRFVLKVMKPH